MRRALGLPAPKQNQTDERAVLPGDFKVHTGFHDPRYGVEVPYGFEIFRTYKGRDYKAQAIQNFSIYDGKGYSTLSELNSAIGISHENAWSAWRYHDKQGSTAATYRLARSVSDPTPSHAREYVATASNLVRLPRHKAGHDEQHSLHRQLAFRNCLFPDRRFRLCILRELRRCFAARQEAELVESLEHSRVLRAEDGLSFIDGHHRMAAFTDLLKLPETAFEKHGWKKPLPTQSIWIGTHARGGTAASVMHFGVGKPATLQPYFTG